MKNKIDSYRQIMKATSIFGGVQFFHIIISLMRSKVLAVLLGPAGMGISGLFANTIGMIQSLTNFGLGTSAVKDIAIAHKSENQSRINTIVTVFRRLVLITGFLGLLITLIFAPLLSNITFGNENYTVAFRWLAFTLLLNQLTSGQNVLLQGTRKLTYLAKANTIGALSSLLISLPLYYFFGVDGIVPAIIGSSLFTLIIAMFFAKKIKIKKQIITYSEVKNEGSAMLKLGFTLSLSGLITSIAAYLVSIFISNLGGIEEMGLYNAGFAIIVTYVGMVFSAMITDYYPRLAAVANNQEESLSLINQQATIAILILSPILIVLLVFINFFVIFLYSSKFIGVIGMIHWAALGMYFKAVSWALVIYILAKGSSKLYFINSLIFNICLLIFNLLGYYFLGLDGLGISYLIAFIIYSIQVYFIIKTKYQFKFDIDFILIFFVQLTLGLLSFLSVSFLQQKYSYIIGVILIILSIWHSFIELDKRLNLKELVLKKNKE